ncbi:hypothetical protein E2C01_010729 [Portunus trituberculatus]|uniref:Uncharacterized protein n=1 Tax=Portunus trituberculatus TaxID=210409 RepID=A0A5B7D9F1_PORTR|nr:hypothetical protein [Portunus trituberculatus]
MTQNARKKQTNEMHKKHGGKTHEIFRSIGHLGHGRHRDVGVSGRQKRGKQGTVDGDLSVSSTPGPFQQTEDDDALGHLT